ncbi:MAG: hypothetical protein H6673_07490 [Anaerolineales bacterium]|nr:hypothetical protein [Anaerolineales bacterium]
MKSVRRFIHGGLLLALLVALMPVSAQAPATATHIFTWRPAALTLEYPAEWQAGVYESVSFLTSSPDGYTKAVNGDMPEEPAIAFYYYPATASLEPDALLAILFPTDTAPTTGSIGGTTTTQVNFVDAATDQHILAIAFRSPATRHAMVLAAITPSAAWEEFQPALTSLLGSAQFYIDSAALALFDTQVQFEYSNTWAQATNGQVVVAAPTTADAEAVLAGDLATPFVRAQLLTPSGIGVDASDPAAAETILLRFAGLPEEEIEILTRFAWAEGMPAASAWLELDGVRLALVAVVHEDTALLIGGGAPVEQWEQVRAQVFAGINLTTFAETFATDDLTTLITGTSINETTRRFGMVID